MAYVEVEALQLIRVIDGAAKVGLLDSMARDRDASHCYHETRMRHIATFPGTMGLLLGLLPRAAPCGKLGHAPWRSAMLKTGVGCRSVAGMPTTGHCRLICGASTFDSETCSNHMRSESRSRSRIVGGIANLPQMSGHLLPSEDSVPLT